MQLKTLTHTTIPSNSHRKETTNVSAEMEIAPRREKEEELHQTTICGSWLEHKSLGN